MIKRYSSLAAMLAGFALASSRSDAAVQDVQTVFIILMENHDWSSIKGSSSAPYINNVLLPTASHAEQYYNPPGLHPSLPNYIWLEAGTNFNITSNVLPSSGHLSSANHLVTLLKNAGVSWRSYQEDICGCLCPLVATNLYVPRHNPMVYFDDVTNTNDANSAYCIANVRAYSQLAGDLQSNTVARYNFITPNQCNNMHNSSGCATSDSVKNGDNWLSNNIPAILNSQAYSNNGAIFLTFDEGTGTSDGPIAMIVISPLAKGGGYSNTLHYTHSSTLRTLQEIFNVTPLLGDAVNATDLSDLFSAQLSVSPGLGLGSSGLVGGPFNPGSLTYSLSNSAAITLSWAASKTANWVTLSSTSGTLAPGSNTTVTISINTNANSLTIGGYLDTISFTNTTNGDGNTTRPVNLTVASPTFGFFDDFSTYATGNLVGQQSWTQLPSISTLPLQVSSGQVVIPFGQSVDNQDAYKNFTTTNITAFYGTTLIVSNAPVSSTPSYFAAMYTSSGAGGFANFRLSARDNGGGTFVLGARITGQSGDPYTFGTTGLAYATQYRVIVEADSGGTVMKVFVNPTSSNLGAQTPYHTHNIGVGGTPPASVGSFVISQFASGSFPNVGASFVKAVVADNFATVYNNLLGIVPPAASFSASPTNGVEPLTVTFSDTSTGTITNRFWNFGDTSTANATTNVVVHTYAGGTYSVTLVASGPAGVSTSAQPNSVTVLTAFQDWQIENFGGTNNPAAAPAADPDGDGQSNMAEFLTGTDPSDNTSAFRIASIVQVDTNVLVTWTMGPGKTNALEKVAGGMGSFTNNFDTLFTVTNTVGTTTNYLDVGAIGINPTRYYRVRLVP